MSEVHPLAVIVEGHGEVQAVPVLLRRMIPLIDPARRVEILRPIRVPRGKLLKELGRHVDLAARQTGPGGSVLVLLDADDDCPVATAPPLLQAAAAARSDINCAVVLPVSEFEAWFLAAAVSLRGYRGLPDDLEPPTEPESVRDAKGWLQARRADGFAYSPTTDQPALTAVMDLEAARSGSASFDKLWRDIERLVSLMP